MRIPEGGIRSFKNLEPPQLGDPHAHGKFSFQWSEQQHLEFCLIAEPHEVMKEMRLMLTFITKAVQAAYSSQQDYQEKKLQLLEENEAPLMKRDRELTEQHDLWFQQQSKLIADSQDHLRNMNAVLDRLEIQSSVKSAQGQGSA